MRHFVDQDGLGACLWGTATIHQLMWKAPSYWGWHHSLGLNRKGRARWGLKMIRCGHKCGCDHLLQVFPSLSPTWRAMNPDSSTVFSLGFFVTDQGRKQRHISFSYCLKAVCNLSEASPPLRLISLHLVFTFISPFTMTWRLFLAAICSNLEHSFALLTILATQSCALV